MFGLRPCGGWAAALGGVGAQEQPNSGADEIPGLAAVTESEVAGTNLCHHMN